MPNKWDVFNCRAFIVHEKCDVFNCRAFIVHEKWVVFNCRAFIVQQKCDVSNSMFPNFPLFKHTFECYKVSDTIFDPETSGEKWSLQVLGCLPTCSDRHFDLRRNLFVVFGYLFLSSGRYLLSSIGRSWGLRRLLNLFNLINRGSDSYLY